MKIELPRGVAVVRVNTPLGKVLLCSERLSEQEAKVACVLACALALRGQHAVLLHETEVARVTREVVELLTLF